MGCILSSGGSKDDEGSAKLIASHGEVYVFIPGVRSPKGVDLSRALQEYVPGDLAARLATLRSRIVFTAGAEESSSGKSRQRKTQHSEGGSGSVDAEKAIEEYLPVLLGLTNAGEQVSTAIEFAWTNNEDGEKETTLPSASYELLSMLHLLGMLAFEEANGFLTPRSPAEGYNPKVTEESKRNAVETLLKAAYFLECAITTVLPTMPDNIKAQLPADLSEGMLRALEQQALGQGVEIQLGLAIDNVKASLAVKRRLACEQVKYWEQAQESISSVWLGHGWGQKHLSFVKWKLTEAKAAAYYFHGLILDDGSEQDTHANAVACLQAANVFLKESQRGCMDFSNTMPVTRVPPVWGPMKYLSEKIPKDTLSKSRVNRDVYRQEKAPTETPQLPDFPLALKAEAYTLPEVDPAWDALLGSEPRPAPSSALPSFLANKVERTQGGQAVLPGGDLKRQLGPISYPELVEAR